MPHIALLPGFATDARFSVFRDVRGIDGGFSLFRPLVEAREAVVFRWGIPRHFGFGAALNPFFSLALYREERALTVDARVQRRLAAWLHEQQPRVIVCHSLGCLLLARTILTHPLPSSVKKIILNQGDLALSDITAAVRHAPDVEWVHTYCPWDPSLLASSLLTRTVRAGLTPIKYPRIASHLIPLWRPLNLHMSAMRDPTLLSLIV